MSSGERFARTGEIELCYETFGDETEAPMLLVMELASQMIRWDDDFCQQLADRGFWVIRYDNRDIGRSTILRHNPAPSRGQLIRRDARAASYSLADMASDAVGLLDHLEIGSAHVVGVSMGGMIAQLIAVNHPDRVRSLVSMMSSTGSRRVGQMHPRLYRWLLRRPRLDRESYVQDVIGTYQAIGSRRFPPDPERIRKLAERAFDRGIHPDGAWRQLGAIVSASDRTPLLGQVRVPTTVIHGDADQLVMPSGGRATAAAIPNARLVVIPGMAHDMPPVLWSRIIDAIVQTAAQAQDAAGRPS